MASIRSATFFAAISSASSLLTSLAAVLDAASLEAAVLLEALLPQPARVPTQSARAAETATVFFQLSLRMVLVCSFPVFACVRIF